MHGRPVTEVTVSPRGLQSAIRKFFSQSRHEQLFSPFFHLAGAKKDLLLYFDYYLTGAICDCHPDPLILLLLLLRILLKNSNFVNLIVNISDKEKCKFVKILNIKMQKCHFGKILMKIVICYSVNCF